MTKGLVLTAISSGAVASVVAAHAVVADAAVDGWVQLLPLGQVNSRDGRGPYQVGDRARAEAIVAASQARAGSMDLVIDYDHSSEFAAPQGRPAPAAGWIKQLQVREDGIWGRVEWTAAAAERLGAREYRYLSPVFTHTKEGAVLQLLRAGLTNNPNLPLVAVAAASPSGDEMSELLKKLLAAIGLPATTDEVTAVAHVQGLATAAATQRAEVSRIAIAAGLAGDAGAELVATAVAAVRTAAPDPSKFVPMEQHTAVATQLATLQGDLKRGQAEAAADAAIAEGKLIPAQRAWAIAYHSGDPAAFGTFIAAQPVIVAAGAIGDLKPPADAAGVLTAEEKAVCAQMGVDPDDFLKTRNAEKN